MRRLGISSIAMISGISATAVYGAQPPDTVSSDTAFNTAMGSSALLNLSSVVTTCPSEGFDTCASGNTAAGSLALTANTTGHQNAAFGYYSLTRNTTGYYNTALGTYALWANTTGNGNTGVGNDA